MLNACLRLACLAIIAAQPCCAPRPAAPAPRGADLPAARRLRALAQESPLVIAHRGDSAAFPENTLPAFRSALAVKADLVELDFHQTRDGELVVLHDNTLDRTTDSQRVLGRAGVKVAESTPAEIHRLDAGRWKSDKLAGTHVPTLSESLQAIHLPGAGPPAAIAMVEHKAGDAAVLLEVVRRLGLVDTVLVQSFDWAWLKELHALEPRLALAALSKKEITPALLEDLAATGACAAHWDARTLGAGDVAELQRRGYLVAAYTVDDEISWLGAVAAGLDAITTNRPAALRAVLRRDDRIRRLRSAGDGTGAR